MARARERFSLSRRALNSSWTGSERRTSSCQLPRRWQERGNEFPREMAGRRWLSLWNVFRQTHACLHVSTAEYICSLINLQTCAYKLYKKI